MNDVLTSTLKEIIVDAGLVDTGALRESILVRVEVSQQSITIRVNCKDYIKFHIDENRLVDQFISHPLFEREIEAIYERLVMEVIENLFTEQGIDLPTEINLYINDHLWSS